MEFDMDCYCGGKAVFEESSGTPDYWHVFCTKCKHHHEGYGKVGVYDLWLDAVYDAKVRNLTVEQWKTGWSIMWDR